ncbi:MAG: PQQ-binding-like beta-propeller repeat protein [Phycisphaerae bacterium]
MCRHRFLMTVASLAVAVFTSIAVGQPTDPGGADWPMYVEDGDRTPPQRGTKLVDDLQGIRKVWHFKRHMSVGKGLYPGTLRKTREMGYEPFQGGASSPVVADGTVFVSYYKPNGKAPAKPVGWRTVSNPKEFLPDWFFSVTADDILVAIDAETGKLKWERIGKNKGLNRLSHKRGHWGVSPACADGVVFHLGSMGRLYATGIRDGKELWETPTDPGLEKLRQEHIEAKKLCWDSADRSSLIVAEDVVIVARGVLLAYDRKTGKRVWRTEDRVQSQYSTPTLWRHGGRTYIVANTGEGTLRLIDPKDGSTVWTYDKLGPFMGTLSVTGDRVILNSLPKQEDSSSGLYGGYRLTMTGPEKLWTLPNKIQYQHEWKLDSGPRQKVCIRNGLAYIPLWPKKLPKGFASQRLVIADAKTGEIYSETPYQARRSGARTILIEDRILMIHDDAHGDPINASLWTTGKKPRQLSPDMSFPHVAITAYCTPIIQPYAKGKLYFRALDGLVCYDFRKPADKNNREISLNIPGQLAGAEDDLKVKLYAVKGKIDRGGIIDSRQMHNVDVSKLTWDGEKLGGMLGVDFPRTRKTDWYDVDALVTNGRKLKGTVTLKENAFDKPLKLDETVQTMKHQPAWQPRCDYVLWLKGASFQKGPSPKRLLLFVSTDKEGKLQRLTAWADQTTKTRPVIYPQDIEIKNGRLVGTFAVRYRPDQWTSPLSENGLTAVGVYEIDAKLEKSDKQDVGEYTGTYGAAWKKSRPLTGTIKK